MKARYNIIAFLVIGILGSVNHFMYEWLGENKIVGYFFPINESTWEHLKLLFFPTLIFSLIEYFFVKLEIKNYFFSVAVSVIVGMISTIVLFYSYSGFLGYTIDFINILIYYIALIIMLIVKNKIIVTERFKGGKYSLAGLIICFAFALMFIFFTYNPPHLDVFVPPTI